MALVVDLTHTAHCPGHTGIQGMCRHTLAGLAAGGHAPAPLVFDRYARRWRMPDAAEEASLSPRAAERPRPRRGEKWSPAQVLRGVLRLGCEPDWNVLRGAPLFAPEIFKPRVFAAYGALRERLGGAAGAFFHDAVVLRHPDLSPPEHVARHPSYLRELLSFDGVAANSETSRDELLELWAREGISEHPPVVAIPLGIEPAPGAPPPLPPPDAARGPLVLCVGSIEGRKNHLALLEAAESLWREGQRFRLTLAGLHRPQTAAPALRRAAELRAAGRPLEFPGAIPHSQLQRLYGECTFTVYPSLYEGFGLPVAECLQRGRPCVCGRGGALREVSAGGGCLVLDEPDAPSLARALRELLVNDDLLRRLTAEALARKFRTWREFSELVAAWLRDLRPRARAFSALPAGRREA